MIPDDVGIDVDDAPVNPGSAGIVLVGKDQDC